MTFVHTMLQLNTKPEITYPAWPKSRPNANSNPAFEAISMDIQVYFQNIAP